MALSVVSLFAARVRRDSASGSRDWSQQELAEFYRVESALIQSGLRVEVDRGLTDEGDPWFIFCHRDGGDPVIHFARVGGSYIVASPSYASIATGRDFKTLVRNLLSQYCLAPVTDREAKNVLLHPVALLIAVVGAAFLKATDANALPLSDCAGAHLQNIAVPSNAVTRGLSFEFQHSRGFAEVAISQNYVLVAVAAAAAISEFGSTEGFASGFMAPLSDPGANSDADLIQSKPLGSSVMDFGASLDLRGRTAEAAPCDGSLEKALALVAMFKEIPASEGLHADFHSFSIPPALLQPSKADPLGNGGGLNFSMYDSPNVSAIAVLQANDGDLPILSGVRIVRQFADAVHIEIVDGNESLPGAILSILQHSIVVKEAGTAPQFLVQHKEIFESGAEADIGNYHPQGSVARVPEQVADIVSTPVGYPENPSEIWLFPNSVGPGLMLSEGVLSKILSEFVHSALDMKVYITKDSFVFAPTSLVSSNGNVQLESFTVKFEDGSSISLVGSHLTLQHVFETVS